MTNKPLNSWDDLIALAKRHLLTSKWQGRSCLATTSAIPLSRMEALLFGKNEQGQPVVGDVTAGSLLKYFREFPQNKARTEANIALENISKRALVLAEAIQLANTAIREAACRDAECAGMGSTVVCVLADQNCFSVGHVW